MDQFAIGLIAACLGILLVVLAWQSWRSHHDRARSRAAFLDACVPLFDQPRCTREATGFPKLSGNYRGQRFEILAMPDTLTFRKLPALWVIVTLPARLPVAAPLDMMMRPSGFEPFSNFNRLPEEIVPSEDFPADCAIRTDDARKIPDENALRPHLTFLADRKIKEVVISPRGLRIVFLAEEANRSRYLLFRDAEMGAASLPANDLRLAMDRLFDLHEAIAHPVATPLQQVPA